MTGDDELDIDADADADLDVLVCARVVDKIGYVAKGSQVHECDYCHRLVWVGPVEYSLVIAGTYFDRVLCSHCAVDLAHRAEP